MPLRQSRNAALPRALRGTINYGMSHAAVRYREYLPCEVLRSSVGVVFSFCEPNQEQPDRPNVWELTFGRAVLCPLIRG
jgi:hypothetical protein